MLKSGQLKDSLSPRYTGPYEVVERRGPDVKVRLKRRDKWVHIDNTKRFRGSEDLTDLHSDETQVVSVPTEGTNGEDQQQLQSPESLEAQQEEQDEYTTEPTGYTHASLTSIDRYPQRNRRPPKRFEDYVSWDLSTEIADTSNNPDPQLLTALVLGGGSDVMSFTAFA